MKRAFAMLATFAAGICLQSAGPRPACKGHVLVTNKLGKSLSIVDPELGREVAAVPLTGLNPKEDPRSVPHEAAISPDGRSVWVPIFSDSGMGGEGTDGRSITIVSLAERRAVGFVDLGAPSRPHTPLFGPDGLFYVTTETTESITVVDPKTEQVVGNIATGGAPHFMVFSRDGKRLYVIHGGKDVLVVDVKTRKPVKTIPAGEDIMRLALSADDRYLFTSDETQPRIIVVDTRLTSWSGRLRRNRSVGWLAPKPSRSVGTMRACCRAGTPRTASQATS